jgi:tRNA threonylcarbamoyladenosine biosynthesis protein TsaE
MQVHECDVIFEQVTRTGLVKVASELLTLAGYEKVWLFVGDMGAGKTTLIKEIGKQLLVTDTMSSPSFSIMNEYWTSDKKQVYHFDFYRIKNETEAVEIGIEDYFYSGKYCFLEWPEKIPNLLPDVYVIIKINTTDSNHRTLSFSIHGREEKRI